MPEAFTLPFRRDRHFPLVVDRAIHASNLRATPGPPVDGFTVAAMPASLANSPCQRQKENNCDLRREEYDRFPS